MIVYGLMIILENIFFCFFSYTPNLWKIDFIAYVYMISFLHHLELSALFELENTLLK